MSKIDAIWSIDNQIYFLDGWAWGLDKQLQTICVGKFKDVEKEHPCGKRGSVRE